MTVRDYNNNILKALDNIVQVCHELDIYHINEDCVEHESFIPCIVAGEPFNSYCLHCDKLLKTTQYDPSKMTIGVGNEA